jgi:hypothetical protein
VIGPKPLPISGGLGAVWCRRFVRPRCGQPAELSAQSGRLNFARSRCETAPELPTAACLPVDMRGQFIVDHSNVTGVAPTYNGLPIVPAIHYGLANLARLPRRANFYRAATYVHGCSQSCAIRFIQGCESTSAKWPTQMAFMQQHL